MKNFFFAKIVKRLKAIFAKKFIADVWLGPKYASDQQNFQDLLITLGPILMQITLIKLHSFL